MSHEQLKRTALNTAHRQLGARDIEGNQGTKEFVERQARLLRAIRAAVLRFDALLEAARTRLKLLL